MYYIADIVPADEDIYWRVREVGQENCSPVEIATAASVKYVWRAKDLEYELEKLGIGHGGLTQEQFDYILEMWGNSDDVELLSQIAYNCVMNLPR